MLGYRHLYPVMLHFGNFVILHDGISCHLGAWSGRHSETIHGLQGHRLGVRMTVGEPQLEDLVTRTLGTAAATPTIINVLMLLLSGRVCLSVQGFQLRVTGVADVDNIFHLSRMTNGG